MVTLGHLTKCKIRDIWPMETEFSDWLFEQENINILAEACGLGEIQGEIREDDIGRFRADIFGKEIVTGRKVIIENQFANSDHDHLGKIITYAAGRDADIVIWVTENARPEHASAIEWLNNNFGTGKGFFLAEIELWCIGDSAPAPKFNIIERPNEWKQAVKSEIDDTEIFKHGFWEEFIEYSRKNERLLKAFPGTCDRNINGGDHWLTFSKGCKGFAVNALISTRNCELKSIGVEVDIPDNKELFKRFESNRSSIETAIGTELYWNNKDTVKRSSIQIKYNLSGEDRQYCFDWIADKLIQFKHVFNQYS